MLDLQSQRPKIREGCVQSYQASMPKQDLTYVACKNTGMQQVHHFAKRKRLWKDLMN